MTFPRILSSSKFQGSALATAAAAVPFAFAMMSKTVDSATKQTACNVFIGAISVIWGVSIHATGQEDAAAKANPVQPTSPVDPPPTVTQSVPVAHPSTDTTAHFVSSASPATTVAYHPTFPPAGAKPVAK